MNVNERRNGGKSIEGVFVRPGEILMVRDGTLLVSVVSSGIVVCIWEYAGPLAAMAHFIEPRTDDPRCATAKYGNVAIPKLLSMIQEESPKGKIEAQIFGAAEPPDGFARGRENALIAKKILSVKNIPVVSEDLGGKKGRKLMFDTKTGHVAVIRVHELRKGDWHP